MNLEWGAVRLTIASPVNLATHPYSGGVLRNSAQAELECGLRFTDAVGGAPVLVHLFFAVVEIRHVGVMCTALCRLPDYAA